MKKSAPYDSKLRREVGLLLALKEITVKEVLEHYKLDDSYKNKLYVWRHRAKKDYAKLLGPDQERERRLALERFYGTTQAARRMDMLKAPNSVELPPEEILNDPLIAEFLDGPTEEAPLEVIEEKEDINTEKTLQLTSNVSEPMPVSPGAYENHLQSLKVEGITSVDNTLKTLQNLTNGLLVSEIDFLSNITNQLHTYNLTDLKPRDLKTLAEIAEKVITLRRKALLLPFGHLDPNAKPHTTVNKNLHLHNHGLGNFNPND